MKNGEIIRLRWSPRLKRTIVLFLLVVFFVGTVIGFAVGRVSASNVPQESDKPNIESTYPQTTVEPTVSIPDKIVTIVHPATEPTEPPVRYYDVPLSEDLQDYIRELCEKHDVPMSLIMAMIEVESSFRSNVISGTNDYGLMQINKINHEWLTEEYGITDFLDPYQNVFCGITIIAGHLDKTDGDITLALMRYNCGATGAKRLWDKGIYSTSYTEKIIAAMEGYDEI